MQTLTITLDNARAEFLGECARYGYATADAAVARALDLLRESLIEIALERSAALYAEAYASDADLQELAASAVAELIE